MARAGTPARAVVCAGEVETEYLRAGQGAAVVLLTGEHDDAAIRGLVEVLRHQFLVIAPRKPNDVAFDEWLRNVLDGLGILRASIVADASFMAAALGFAMRNLSRVGHVVLVTSQTADVGSLTQFLHGEDDHDG